MMSDTTAASAHSSPRIGDVDSTGINVRDTNGSAGGWVNVAGIQSTWIDKVHRIALHVGITIERLGL